MKTAGKVLRLFMSGTPTLYSATDLCMFSMLGRTGAPQKGAPTKEAANLCMPEKWATPEWNEWWAKKGRQFFFRKNRVFRLSLRAPYFFLNRALLRVNPALTILPPDTHERGGARLLNQEWYTAKKEVDSACVCVFIVFYVFLIHYLAAVDAK